MTAGDHMSKGQGNPYGRGPPPEREGYDQGSYGDEAGHNYSNYDFMPAGSAYEYERVGALAHLEK